MSKMAELDLNRQEHLTFIASCSEIVSRRARALSSVPPWKTAAVDELKDAEIALEAALQKVREAMAAYEAKPIEV